jgi:hypothetical protein
MEKLIGFLILKEFYVIATYWHKERIHAATCNGGFLVE